MLKAENTRAIGLMRAIEKASLPEEKGYSIGYNLECND
jgi:hypothetical protein